MEGTGHNPDKPASGANSQTSIDDRSLRTSTSMFEFKQLRFNDNVSIMNKVSLSTSHSVSYQILMF